MLNNPYESDERPDILERLKHPEREEASRTRRDKTFVIRNVLNIVFIVLAVAAIIGVLVTPAGDGLMVWYGTALFAVLVKMVEVVFRMPGMKASRRR